MTIWFKCLIASILVMNACGAPTEEFCDPYDVGDMKVAVSLGDDRGPWSNEEPVVASLALGSQGGFHLWYQVTVQRICAGKTALKYQVFSETIDHSLITVSVRAQIESRHSDHVVLAPVRIQFCPKQIRGDVVEQNVHMEVSVDQGDAPSAAEQDWTGTIATIPHCPTDPPELYRTCLLLCQ